MTIDNNSEELPFDGSVSIPHLKSLWKLLKEISKELFTPRVTGVKVLAAVIFGVTYIPQLFPYPMHVSFSFSLRLLYIWCWYSFVAEFPWLLIRLSEQHQVYFWLICVLLIAGIWHYVVKKRGRFYPVTHV